VTLRWDALSYLESLLHVETCRRTLVRLTGIRGLCMSTRGARSNARRARKSASEDIYKSVRNLELAIDALAREIEKLRSEAPKAVTEKGWLRRRLFR